MRDGTFVGAFVLALLAAAGMIAITRVAAQTPEALTLRVMVVSSSAEAERVRERVRQGQDFALIARQSSIDPSAPRGGLLGRVELSMLRPELRRAVEGVPAGSLSVVVPVPTGFAFFKVENSEPSDPPADLDMMAALSAVGSVRYVLNVGGLPEAEAVLRDFPKPPNWNQDPQLICRMRRESLASARQTFDRFFSPELDAVRSTRPPFDLMQANLGLAQLLAYVGDMERALPYYLEAYRTARASVPAAVPTLEETLGLAYLHKAEMDNDAYRAPGDICLIPPGRWDPASAGFTSGQAFRKTDDARQAFQHFLSYLKAKPDDLEVRWLLNITAMMLGTYPAEVPAPQLIPPSAFASTEDIGRFRDVAPQAGLNVFATAGGVIVDDLAGNGRFDVVTSNFFSCGPMHYFGDNGDGTYTERTAAAGLSQQVGGLNIVQTDYNNDGCKDMLVLRGGWEVPQRLSLMRNMCNGTFSDVTVESGLGGPATASQTAAWIDINNDGWLDLFVGNEDAPSQLFLNHDGTRFENISQAAGIDRLAFVKAVTAGDYDNDGFADFYLSNYNGSNLLFHNNRNNTFTEVARAAGVPGPGRGFGAWFFDYDNDGWLDLFATSYFMSVDETARTYLKLPHNAPTLKLYRNLGNGTFRDMTASAGLDKVFMPMGANFGDVDNDGFLDMYLGMGTPSYGSIAPHVLLRNHDGQFFADITASSGTGELHKGHGVAFADLDHDGDEDIVAEIGGATPGDSHVMRLFENPGQGNDWVSLKLVGVKSNRAAIGTRITVKVENEGTGARSIVRTVGSGGTFGASPLEQHIGLGKAATIVDVEVWWPASNTRQHFSGLAKNKAFEITELNAAAKPIERAPVRLGGARRTQ